MKILIIGATGKTGQKLLRQLQPTPHEIYGLIREEKQANAVRRFDAVPVQGDLREDLRKTIRGFDAIMFVAGSRGKDVRGVDYQGLVNAVDATVVNGIERFLYLGSINAGKQPQQFIAALKRYYHDLEREPSPGLLAATENPKYHVYVEMKMLAERYLIDSGLNYSIFCGAGLLTQEAGSGRVTVTAGKPDAFGEVARDNLAACFIVALDNPCTYRKIYTVADGDTAVAQAF